MDINGHTPLYEDYVSFETAKLLKERGFNEKCRTFYINNTSKITYIDQSISNEKPFNLCLLAPTHQMALKWLREVHNKNIILDMVPLDEDSFVLWTFNVCCNKSYKIMWGTKQPKYNTYEEAVEAAIKYCLINLIK